MNIFFKSKSNCCRDIDRAMNTKMSMYFPAPNTGVLCVWCEDMYRHCLLGGEGEVLLTCVNYGGRREEGYGVCVVCVFFLGGGR